MNRAECPCSAEQANCGSEFKIYKHMEKEDIYSLKKGEQHSSTHEVAAPSLDRLRGLIKRSSAHLDCSSAETGRVSGGSESSC